MLTATTRALADRGHGVTCIARRAADLGAGIRIEPVDYRDPTGLQEALARSAEARGPIELAVCWIHTDAPDAPRIVAGALAPGARLVQVFGTRVWPLADVPLHVAYRQVVLGSADGRWLNHEEISLGVLEAVDADLPLHVVGTREARVSD
jgi:hypothetical protein